jgi:alkylation response protein AidB-like acyl-CoA dehydrogenase
MSTQTQQQLLETVEKIATEIVAKQAIATDKSGQFPEAAIAALAKAGVLGTLSAQEAGGHGLGPRAAVLVVERLAKECSSTAMIVCMHFSAVAVLEKFAPLAVRQQVASGATLATLAFSETGSRSQFWAPVSSAKRTGDKIILNGTKSWVTSASRAGYVWSSKPVATEGASTIWWVPPKTKGTQVTASFDGLGLRGNDSSPVVGEAVEIPAANMLGADGEGFKIMLEVVLPFFNAMNAGASVGLMESAVARTAAHVTSTTFAHSGTTVADLPTVRAFIARMRVKTDLARALVLDTVTALETGRADAVLRVLESKAAAGELATEVLDLAMRVCGGSAFRKEVGVERLFRDSRAAAVMAPTVDVLYEFIGKAVCNLPLF